MRRLATTAVAVTALLAVTPLAHADHLGGGNGCSPVEQAGTDGPDSLAGARVVGFGGDDRITGTDGVDCLSGGGGADAIDAGAGNDSAYGRSGADALTGGGGNDFLAGEAGRDRYDAGPGDDRVEAADGERDVVECGDGADFARIDDIDAVSGCESVIQVPARRLRAAPSRGTTRTRFVVRWVGSFDLRDECIDPEGTCDPYGFVKVERLAAPRDGRRCDVRDWGVGQQRGARFATARWGGRRAPCAGAYRWRLSYVATSVGWTDCDVLEGFRTPRPGEQDTFGRPAWNACRPEERIGDLALRVGRNGRVTTG